MLNTSANYEVIDMLVSKKSKKMRQSELLSKLDIEPFVTDGIK